LKSCPKQSVLHKTLVSQSRHTANSIEAEWYLVSAKLNRVNQMSIDARSLDLAKVVHLLIELNSAQ
jgi:hypothetical protein